MKKILKILALVFGIVMILIVTVVLLTTPAMDRWGATENEIAATYVGDDLVPNPASIVNHAVTIRATPEQIYPWIVQLGADKGGMYSYTWLEKMIKLPAGERRPDLPGMAEFTGGRSSKNVPWQLRPPAIYSCSGRST